MAGKKQMSRWGGLSVLLDMNFNQSSILGGVQLLVFFLDARRFTRVGRNRDTGRSAKPLPITEKPLFGCRERSCSTRWARTLPVTKFPGSRESFGRISSI